MIDVIKYLSRKQRQNGVAMKTDIEIAQEAKMLPITEIASKLGIEDDELELYGKYKAKINDQFLKRTADKKNGKLILVTGISKTDNEIFCTT